VRPAIIIAAYQEPSPGWIDAMTAAGPLTVMMATGVLTFIVATSFVRSDIIPVDLVSNQIILGTAMQANKDSL
jgi:fatty acyl-CoA reductase